VSPPDFRGAARDLRDMELARWTTHGHLSSRQGPREYVEIANPIAFTRVAQDRHSTACSKRNREIERHVGSVMS
jgi:hypothetical protein